MTKESQNSTVKPDVKTVLNTETDGTVVLSSDKSAFLNMDKILSIGVRNIIDIKNYQHECLEYSTRHFIEFHDGGTVNIEYSDDGKIIEFSIRDLSTRVSNGEIMIEKKK